MVAGMGGLTQGYSDLADAGEKMDMMDPKQIMDNMAYNNQLMGPSMQSIQAGKGPLPI